jgi:N-acetylglutamate synthase-like GNAT family acetyltransferase
MNFIKIEPNPWLQYGAKVPLADNNMRTIEKALNTFLKDNGILLNRIAYAWSDEDGKFKIVNNENGTVIARCSIQNVRAKV